ncbi:hypothetical protein AGQ53_06795 [Salmonella enterica subsp. enterica]|nr:hypothetical protein AGQ53_06795 [Salmonella enterica subsp. enterica]
METHSYFAEPRGFIWLREGEITIIWRNVVQTFQADLAIIGAGGAGLRAAIAAAQANPNAKIALISKVYPMRSHTVAAEGGSAAVAQDHARLV